MKKIAMLSLVMSLLVLLVGCNGLSEGDYPKLNDSDIVDMSTLEVAQMLETAMEEANSNDIYKVTFSGDADILYSQYSAISAVTLETAIQTDFNIEGYFKLSDQVSESQINFNAEMNLYFSNGASSSGLLETYPNTEFTFNGSLGAYLFESDMYLNYDLERTISGQTVSLSAKQKVEDMISQDDWSSSFNANNFINSMYDIPEVNSTNIEELMNAYEAFTVYQSGKITFVEFDVSKDTLKNNYGALFTWMYQQEHEIAPTDEAINSAIAAFNNQLDEELSSVDISLVFAIEDQKLVQFALEGHVVLNDDHDSNANMLLVFDYVSAIPRLPKDADTYTLVPSIDLSPLIRTS